jgi:phosphoserine aminotransferase
MQRPYNFSPGPSTLPIAVLERAALELLNWPDEDGKPCGMSVMEMSHRGSEFISIYRKAMANLRTLLAVPDHFKILFLQGGALLQNSVVPLNLCTSPESVVAFVRTGAWSGKSLIEASRYCLAKCAVNAEINGCFTSIPNPATWEIANDAEYVHICSNETIHGVEFHELPDLKKLGSKAELVVDCSSDIASGPMDWTRIGLAFAGAQKNLGIAGLTLVFVREDLLGRAQKICPEVMNYTIQSENESMLNTPPTYAIYMAGLVFEWLLSEGGLLAMQKKNKEKARLLYATIDNSSYYSNNVDSECRSLMNVPFYIQDKAKLEAFLHGATQHGLLGLKGHKSVGGLRASLFNAMTLAGTESLVAYLKWFELENAS